jgi:2-polyprenyl-6-methoxyphenol hydroxylase-like FAD-dependent oxidoreductase
MKHAAAAGSESRHAIVIGAGMAGLITARVLLDHFDRVTIIDRDRLPETPVYRAAVPQSRHVHALLKRGETILESLFPGITAELIQGGATPMRWTTDILWYHLGGYRERHDLNLQTIVSSRAVLEWTVRRRLTALAGVRIVEGTTVTGLLADTGHRFVRGVRIRNGDPDPSNGRGDGEERAGLVVDTGGRESKAPLWLSELGYEPPPESVINGFVGYTSRVVRPSQACRKWWKAAVLYPTPETTSRTGFIFPTESGDWLVSLAGVNRDYAPSDEQGFLEYARTLSGPDIYDAIKDAEPVSPIYSFRHTENRRRHYEKLRRAPEGFVALGDSVCTFDPKFGQGMTVSAISATILGDCMREQRRRHPSGAVTGLAARFPAALARSLFTPWFLATSEDLRYPGTEGGELGPATKLLQRYTDRIIEMGVRDADACHAFCDVLNMVKPPTSLFRPNLAWQVARRSSGKGD